MIIGKPAPFVSAFIDAVDTAIRAHQPHHAMSATQRAWLAFCLTAVLVTNSICWARFERASLGTYALAALSWMFRHSKIPWDHLLVASVRVILRHHGITSGSLVVDDTDNQRSKSAKALAHLYKLRDKASGGYLWGQSLVFLVLVTAKISIPVGFVFSQPAPELSAWYKKDKALKKLGVPKPQRPPKPAPDPRYPTKQHLALHLLEAFKAHHPDIRVHCITADALYGTAPFVDGASALFGGVQVLSHIRSNQHIRVGKREQHVADYFATHPGTPHRIRIRGGDEVVAMVGSARLYVCSHKTKRLIVAIKYEDEETYRYLIASDLSWRTLDVVQGHTLRWLVEVFIQDWKSHEGWAQLTKQPGEEGARHSVILSLLVDHSLFVHPDQQDQLKNNLPAYTVGSLRAHVQVECLVDVIDDLVSSDEPQEKLKRFTTALHEVFAFGRSKKHMIQRQLGRLEPTPSLKYRTREVMRNMPVMST
ncbi:MAG: transposase [Cyanobacteria bacterium 13_1_40CM_2_61_4]|nr:MAG: transposase [Cyanobacteria bacterium 13_1_40CM_2_61_4]